MKFVDNERSYLHIWKAHSRGTGFGHISLELSNNCYISFWPENGTKSCQIKNDNCPAKWFNSVKEEIMEHGHPTTIFVYGLNVEAIKSWWTLFLLDKPKYDVREQNCAVVVYRALCEGSSWFEENTSDCTGIKTPDRVFYYVKNGYHKNTRVGCGCSCGHCLSLHPYRCVGFIFFYIYKFCLGLFSVWQCLKRMILKREQNQFVTKIEEDAPTNSSKTKHSIIDLEVPCRTAAGVQESGYDSFIDIRSKVMQPKQETIPNPRFEDHNSSILTPSNSGVKYRQVNTQH